MSNSHVKKILGYVPSNSASLKGLDKATTNKILFEHIQRHGASTELYGRKNLERKKLHSHMPGSSFSTTDRPVLRDAQKNSYIIGHFASDPRSILQQLKDKNKAL